MKKIIALLIFISILFPFSFTNCYDDEVTKVIIEMKFDNEKYAFHNPSLIDKILMFFSKTAHAAVDQTILDNLFAVTIDIYIPGGGIIHKNFDLNNPQVVMNIPAGPGRVFDLKAYIHPINGSSVLMFRGVKIVNLQPGVLKNVPIVIRAYDTKLVIPDYSNGVIHQLDFMNDTSLTTAIGSSFSPSFGANLKPYDIDFDAWGNIYLANNITASSTYNKVYKISNLSTRSVTLEFSQHDPGIVTVAVDRIRNIVYYSNGTALYKNNLDASSEVALNQGIINSIRGIDVNEFGILFIAGNDGSNEAIFKYDPTGSGTIINQKTALLYPSLTYASDVIVQNGLVFLANTNGNSGNKIIVTTYNLDFVGAFGNTPILKTDPYALYGPRRFINGSFDRVFVLDEETLPGNIDRIISIDYLHGLNWNIAPDPSGAAETTFGFYQEGP